MHTIIQYRILLDFHHSACLKILRMYVSIHIPEKRCKGQGWGGMPLWPPIPIPHSSLVSNTVVGGI